IVRDLKMFSRSNEDDRAAPVDVRRCVEGCLKIAANELRHRGRVRAELAPVPLVLASEPRLAQVFLNLIINAAHALPEGVTTNELSIRTFAESSGHVAVEVADNGCGIDPAAMPRIFDPFFTTKPVGVGTGLGLAIARRIISGFGGEISVASVVG